MRPVNSETCSDRVYNDCKRCLKGVVSRNEEDRNKRKKQIAEE